MSFATGSFSTNFGTINAGVTLDTVKTINGAAEYGWCAVGWPVAGLPAGIVDSAWVSGVDQVTLRLFNPTAGNIAVNNLAYMLRATMEGA